MNRVAYVIALDDSFRWMNKSYMSIALLTKHDLNKWASRCNSAKIRRIATVWVKWGKKKKHFPSFLNASV